MRSNNAKFREHKNVSVAGQNNIKVDIIEKELIKSKMLMQDLRKDAERACLEYKNCKISTCVEK